MPIISPSSRCFRYIVYPLQNVFQAPIISSSIPKRLLVNMAAYYLLRPKLTLPKRDWIILSLGVAFTPFIRKELARLIPHVDNTIKDFNHAIISKVFSVTSKQKSHEISVKLDLMAQNSMTMIGVIFVAQRFFLEKENRYDALLSYIAALTLPMIDAFFYFPYFLASPGESDDRINAAKAIQSSYSLFFQTLADLLPSPFVDSLYVLKQANLLASFFQNLNDVPQNLAKAYQDIQYRLSLYQELEQWVQNLPEDHGVNADELKKRIASAIFDQNRISKNKTYKLKENLKLTAHMTKALNQYKYSRKEDFVVLDLSNLGLKEIPPVLFKLKNLTDLDLSFNKIRRLSSEINELSHLHIVNLADNCLESAQDFVVSDDLQTLILDNNTDLTKPPCVNQGHIWCDISITNTQIPGCHLITELDEWIAHLDEEKKNTDTISSIKQALIAYLISPKKLSETAGFYLDLSDCKLNEIPPAFAKLPGLKKIIAPLAAKDTPLDQSIIDKNLVIEFH